jgi:hypothetical protein
MIKTLVISELCFKPARFRIPEAFDSATLASRPDHRRQRSGALAKKMAYPFAEEAYLLPPVARCRMTGESKAAAPNEWLEFQAKDNLTLCESSRKLCRFRTLRQVPG